MDHPPDERPSVSSFTLDGWTVRAEGATSDSGTSLVIGTWHHKVELYVR